MVANAQQYLIVQKRGTVKNHKYEVGHEISFQTKKGEKNFAELFPTS